MMSSAAAAAAAGRGPNAAGSAALLQKLGNLSSLMQKNKR